MLSCRIYSALTANTKLDALNNCQQIFENQIVVEIRTVLWGSGKLLNVKMNV